MGTVPVGKDPVGAWPAANGHVYVDNETDQTVTEINVATGAVTETINLGLSLAMWPITLPAKSYG